MFFALGLGVFGVAWLAMLYLAGADWSVTMRRIPEAMTAWLLPGGVLAMAVGLGRALALPLVARRGRRAGRAPDAQGAVPEHDDVHRARRREPRCSGSCSPRCSSAPRTGRTGKAASAPTRKSRTLSALFLVVFALTLSIVSFYLLLSLEAHWFSTMFAVLVFTDVVQTGTAFVAVVAGLLVMTGKLKGFLNENHLHSLGKMVFASTGFWAYIYFCQFMLIWYANLPEETVYFLRRVRQRLAAVPADPAGAEVRRAVPAPAAAGRQAQPEEAGPGRRADPLRAVLWSSS